jgi:aromatic-L-amino-acid/L-tryptophan decarboxylase
MTALAVARHVKCDVDVRADGLRAAPRPFAFYMSAEAHGCARKAIELLGFGSRSIRTIPVDDNFRMDLDALQAALDADREECVQPIAVIATAGSTNTGAIDDLASIADLCRHHDVWMHVDAAYGGPAILSGEYGARLRALSRADSIAIDPHKWMFVPVEAGLVMVRDAQAMRSTFSLVPPYLRTDGNAVGVGGPPWFSEYGFQQTRGFRALKVWMTLQQFGVKGLAAIVDANIDLARRLAERVERADDFELSAPPSLSVVCFRYTGGLHGTEQEIAALNRTLLERLQRGGDAFITSTELRGRFVLRACIVNYRSTLEDVDRLVDAVRAIGTTLLGVR